MEPNTHSSVGPGAGGRSDWLVSLTAAVDALDAEDLTGLPDATLAEQLLELRRLVDRLEGQWLQRLAAVDARGAAGAEQGIQVGSTAAWLRRRLHVGAGAAASLVRTARALFRGPLTATAAALTAGEITTAHAAVVAHGTRDLPAQVVAEAEPVLVEAAGRLDPPRLRPVLDHLQQVTDPDGADRESERRQQRRGLWLAPTWEGMVALHGLLDPEGGHTLLAALEPLARPADGQDGRSGDQRRADALVELARRNLESGRLPQTGGVRPQLAVVVDLHSLLDPHGAMAGEVVAGEVAGRGRWPRRSVGGWPATARSPECWSAASPPTDTPATAPPAARDRRPGTDPGSRRWGSGCGRRWLGCRRSWAAPPANPWRLAAPPGSSPPPSAPRWPSVTGLCVPRLLPTPDLVRGPSSDQLARRRPDRPDQPGPPLSGPSSGGARGRLAAGPRPRWRLERPTAPSTTPGRGLRPPRQGRVAPLLTVPGEWTGPNNPDHRGRRARGPERPRPPCQATAWGPSTPTTVPGNYIGPK